MNQSPKQHRKRPFKRPRGHKLFAPMLLGALAVAIVTTGTLAYYNFSQAATNIAKGVTNNGARLHDDYAGEISGLKDNDKDVYVENYGLSPLLVRVKLEEYLWIKGADIIGTSTDEEGDIVESYVTNIHKSRTEASKHLDLIYGGEAGGNLDGQKWFLPTDNVDDDEHASQTNADKADNIVGRTYYGDDGSSGAQTGDTTITPPVTIADVTNQVNPFTGGETAFSKNVHINPLYNSAKDAGSTGTDLDGNAEIIGLPIKQTLKAQVIPISEWLVLTNAEKSALGETWIADTDGWYYWSALLLPGDATGLLVDAVNVNAANPFTDDYKYKLNAVMEAVSVDEMNALWDDTANAKTTQGYASANAQRVLAYAAQYQFGIAPFTEFVGLIYTDLNNVKWRVLDVSPVENEALIVRVNALNNLNPTTNDLNSASNVVVNGLKVGGASYEALAADIKAVLPAEGNWHTVKFANSITTAVSSTYGEWKPGPLIFPSSFDYAYTGSTASREGEATTTAGVDGWLIGAPYDFANVANRTLVTDAGTAVYMRSRSMGNATSTVHGFNSSGSYTVNIAATATDAVQPMAFIRLK